MTSFGLTNFQKVKYFNLTFEVPRSDQPELEVCHTNPALAKLRLDLIEEESQELSQSLETKNYPEILDAVGSILYVVLGASDSFGFNLDHKLSYQNIEKLILKYQLDQLPYIDQAFSRTRMNCVFDLSSELLEKIHIDYQTQVQKFRLLIQKGDYSSIINHLVLLHDYCYLMAYLFGFNLNTVFDLIHESNMTKLAESQSIAEESVQKYQKDPRYDSPKYRMGFFNEKNWIIYNNKTGKILKSITYQPVDLDYFLDNPIELVIEGYHIISLKSPSYLKLEKSEKEFLHYFSQLTLKLQDLRFYQKNHLGLMIKKLLWKIYLEFRFDFDFIIKDLESWQAFVEYFYLFWLSEGIHNFETGNKIKARFSPEYWDSIIQNTRLNLKGFDDWKIKINRIIFQEDCRAEITKSNNLYLGLWPESAQKYYLEKEKLYNNLDLPILLGINTRMIEDVDEKITDQSYHQIWPKLFQNLVSDLGQLEDLAYFNSENSKNQKELLQKLIQYFHECDLFLLNEFLVEYAKSNQTLEWILGFLDLNIDPYQRKGLISGAVYLNLKQESELLFKLGHLSEKTSFIPQKKLLEKYPSKNLVWNNFNNSDLLLNSKFIQDSEGNFRKIHYSSLDHYLMDSRNFENLESLPFF